MARVSKKQPDPNAEAVAALVAEVVKGNPRGAPITIPAPARTRKAKEPDAEYDDYSGPIFMGGIDDNPTPIVEDAINAPAAEPLHEPTAIHLRAPEAGPFCVLDDAPVNSVLVALAWPGQPTEPHLQTPAGQMPVPEGDLAWRLPLLGEIKRVGPRTFVAIQRDDPIGRPPLVCSTAVEACQKFKKYFHDERD
jgi:hypothetical protein